MVKTILKWTVKLLFSIAGWIIVWAAKLLAVAAWWGIRQAIAHPRSTLGVGAVGAALLTVGWPIVVSAVGIVILAGSVWQAAHRDSFDRIVMPWLRTWARRWWTYRRVWASTMARCGLVVEHGDEQHVPAVKKVSTTEYWDRLRVRLQVGQEFADYQVAAEKLRHAFDAERVAVREIDPQLIGIDFMRRDPFRTISVPAAAMPATVEDIDWSAVPVGLTEHLEPLTVSLVGGHTAGAGSTNAGKAGLEWNTLRSIAPAIAAEHVRLVMIDPKGRELRQGIELCKAGVHGTKYATERGKDDPGPDPSGDYAHTCRDTVALLERLAGELEAENARAGEVGERDFTPSRETPLTLILIDEGAPLLAYWPRGKRDRIEDALGIILTQGRAAGYIVMLLIQEPTKDIFKVRDLFARRFGLRLPTEDHTDAALTDNASDRGAECSRIPEALPGVLFSFEDGAKVATRGRLGHVRNEDIAELVEFVRHQREANRFAARRAEITGEAAA